MNKENCHKQIDEAEIFRQSIIDYLIKAEVEYMEASNLQLDSNIKSQILNLIDRFTSNDQQDELVNEINDSTILIQNEIFQNQCFIVLCEEIANELKGASRSSNLWLETLPLVRIKDGVIGTSLIEALK